VTDDRGWRHGRSPAPVRPVADKGENVSAETLIRVDHARLHAFTRDVFKRFAVPEADATIAAEVLVHADLLGIDSHGVARLAGHPGYVPGLQRGHITPQAHPRIVQETAAVARLDGDSGLGGVVSTRAMALAIAKAADTGVGMVSVTNSHHYGIACHYAMRALTHGMIGISMTNAAPQVVPTYGKTALLGTNPLSIAVPTGQERPFILDMATSVGAAGKVELAVRSGKLLPEGWLVDAAGVPTRDPQALWHGGSLLPLGSQPELASYKGYGLAVAVDVLCGVLSGAGYSATLDPIVGTTGHFFAAVRIDAFRPLADFVAMMDTMLHTLRSAPVAPGASRVYVHGEKELDTERQRLASGIPLHPTVVESLAGLARELELPLPFD
jgi:L-2-hydroxycarboxylate dehydrogenase (NAD+)